MKESKDPLTDFERAEFYEDLHKKRWWIALIFCSLSFILGLAVAQFFR